MNLLTDEPTRRVTVAGKSFPVRTDFRTWLRFDKLLKSRDGGKEKLVRLFDLCFCEDTPHDAQAALAALSDFFLMREENDAKPNRKPPKRPRDAARALDFALDAGLIVAAFRQVYGMDLTAETDLHWHVFLSLLRSLPEDCRLCRIMSYRTAELSDIKDPELRRRYAELKEAYALPDNRSPAEKQRAVDDIFADGFAF